MAAPSLDTDGEQQGMGGEGGGGHTSQKLWLQTKLQLPRNALNSPLAKRAIHASSLPRRNCLGGSQGS